MTRALLTALLGLGLGLAQGSNEVWLTGNPVSPYFIEQAAYRTLGWNGLANLRLPPQAPLEVGEQRQVMLGSIPLTLSHAQAPEHRTTQLLLSNDPEKISATRGLFYYRFGSREGVRLVYHHKNTGPDNLELDIRLLNPSPEEVWVWVSDAWAGPAPDEVFVGHMATKRWMELYYGQVGQLIQLLPGAEVSLSRLGLRPGQLVSGILEAVLSKGSAAVLDVYAKAPGEPEPPLESYIQGPVYRLESLETRVQQTHTAGKALLLSLGEGAFQAGNGQKIKGSWGRLYTYQLTLQNPDQNPHTVALQVSADGGVARGVVWLEGQPTELPLLRPGEGFELGRFELAPRTQRQVVLSTLPASGSNYPLRLLLFDPGARDGAGGP